MKAERVRTHNFRTFADCELLLSPYTLVVGANNSGKSNLIDAIRMFYEKDIKYDENRDFPKFPTEDQESWIEIQYRPSDQEFSYLKEDYRLPDGTLIVRKYLKSSELDDERKPKAGMYAYVGGELSNTHFYGARNVQQGKLGDVIYIPAVSKLDDVTKLSGPSALRDLINKVLNKIIGSSPSYGELKSAFEEFGGKLKTEETQDGYSLTRLEGEITDEMNDWGTSFELFINPVSADEIVKNLIGHKLNDKVLGQPLDPKCYGQGLQRHLIYTLIKLSARYNSNLKPPSDREFSPQLTWILFEEPEAFLHPCQIAILDTSLRTISQQTDSQVLISSHNPEFVSRGIEDICSIARLSRDGTSSRVHQIAAQVLQGILTVNQQDFSNWITSGIKISPEDLSIEMESVKYALWLDPKRCCAFFANKVLLVEGPSEVALIGYLLGKGLLTSPVGGLFVMDALGKFNIHRFMNLFCELGIRHAILYDRDGGKYQSVDQTINSSLNAYTIGLDAFPDDLETFLGIPKVKEPRRKPQHIMWYLNQGGIDNTVIDGLVEKVQRLIGQ